MLQRSLTLHCARSVRIQQLLDLTPAQRQCILNLRQMIASQASCKLAGPSASGPSTLVACCVTSASRESDDLLQTSSSSCSPSNPTSSPSMRSIFGVNFNFYHLRNTGRVLRGLLKGCAEQNALGSYAAQGYRFEDISEIFLYGQQRDHDCSREPAAAAAAGEGGPTVVPCRECWGHLCDVADHVASARGTKPVLYVGTDGIGGIEQAVKQLTLLSNHPTKCIGSHSSGGVSKHVRGPSVVIVPCALHSLRHVSSSSHPSATCASELEPAKIKHRLS